MTGNDFIVAIELGSSRVTGIAAKKTIDGGLQLLAIQSEPSATFIRKGMVYNIDKTASCLTHIVRNLEKTLKKSISHVYVGLAGQSVRTDKNIVERKMEAESIVSQETIDRIMDQNFAKVYPDREILDVVAQEYRIGSELQTEPVGIPCTQIEGRFLNITARTTLRSNIEKCFELAGIRIEEIYISAQVLADSVLTDAEKRSGCALIDFGADTTTVSVYKNNILRHLVTLPLGSSNITKDLTSLQIESDEAEQLKLKFGSAYTEFNEEADAENIALSNDRSVEKTKFNDIVEARIEEIINNAWNQINLSNYATSLMAGVVFTGGGSNLKDLELAFKKRTKLDKIKTVKEPLAPLTGNLQDPSLKDGSLISLFAILMKGNSNCCGGELSEENLFTEEIAIERRKREQEEKRKAEEEAQRLAEEEEARRKAEEETRKKEEEEARKKEEEAERKRIRRENSILNKTARGLKQFLLQIIEPED